MILIDDYTQIFLPPKLTPTNSGRVANAALPQPIYVKQPFGSLLCGQACVAMLLRITLDQAIELVGSTKDTTYHELRDALRGQGFVAAEDLVRAYRTTRLPEVAICRTYRGKRLGHWVVRDHDRLLDPEYGILGWGSVPVGPAPSTSNFRRISSFAFVQRKAGGS